MFFRKKEKENKKKSNPRDSKKEAQLSALPTLAVTATPMAHSGKSLLHTYLITITPLVN